MKHTLVAIALAGWLSGCAAAKTELQPRDVIADALSSSVQLFAEREGGVRRAGSGVVLGRDHSGRSVIATAAHLVEPPVEQKVILYDPATGRRLAAEILAVDEKADVALLRAPAELAVQPVRARDSARLGDSVWVVSFPWGRRVTVVNGVVSQIHLKDKKRGIPVEGPVSLIDASVSYGTSGGGVFDGESGALVGLVRGYRTAKLSFAAVPDESLEFPIAGETTVTPTTVVGCLLRRNGLQDLQPELDASVGTSCEEALSKKNSELNKKRALSFESAR